MSGYSPGLVTAVGTPDAQALSKRRFNPVTVLTIYLFLLFFIPYDVEFAPLGGSGTPSNMFAAVLVAIYLVLWMDPGSSIARGTQPLRSAALLFTCTIIASYISANRHMLPALEKNGADRSLIAVAAWLGVLLIAVDGIDDARELAILIRRIVQGVSVMAMVAIFQFFSKFDITRIITIPGFSNVFAYSDITVRSGLTRPASTTAQPLELVAVLAMVLPLAIHRARFAPPDRRRFGWLLVAVIAAALPITVSRSAILVLVVITLVLVPTWPVRERRFAYLVIPAGVVVEFITIPGMISAFVGILSNNGVVVTSTQSRANAYSSAAPFISQHPWFGLGFGTFPPQTYFFTDNQYLSSTIVTGFVGLLALVVLFVTGWIIARRTRQLSTDPETRDFAQSLAASVAASATSFAIFDALSFNIAAGLSFLLLGCVGCLWRLENQRTQLTAVR